MNRSNLTEDDIIKRKLLFDGDGLGDDRRINIALKTFFRWCANTENEEEQTNNYERILLMLNNCEHSIAKSQIGQQTNHEEMASYMSLYKKIEEDIVDSQRRISELRNDLVKAIVGRKNKQEYDLLAKIIKEHPDRRETLAKLNQLEQEIHGLQGLKDELIKRLEARSREFHVFMNSAYELQYLQSQEEDANFDNRIEQIIRPKPDEI